MNFITAKKPKVLIIDSSVGGNGDIWMRLVGFYSMAALLPELKLHIVIPPFLRNLANTAFGDRLFIVDNLQDCKPQLTYTTLGFKNLIMGVLTGKRYISPYQRAVINDKKNRSVKDFINIGLFNICDYFGWVQVPGWEWIECYQGYLDIIGIKALREVVYSQFVMQLHADYDSIYQKLNNKLPVSMELVIPSDLNQSVIVFPTGTSRQFIPITWAKKHLPNAYYAFFYKDKDAEVFRQEGLNVVLFYHEPGDIIFLSQKAKWTISTDSFPSHLLQYSSEKCTITITEVLRSRIIAPVFKGRVIDAEVTCHPCLHLDRKNHPTCMAGFTECQNWKSKAYTQNIMDSVLENKS